jgi:hypothetical protein
LGLLRDRGNAHCVSYFAIPYNWIEGAPLQPQYVMLGFFALAGIVIWLIGRAAKYVLAGL